MKRFKIRKPSGLFVLAAACALLRGADCPLDGGNPQRTGWQQDETTLAKENGENLMVLWKLQLDNAPREMHSLFPPLIAGPVKTNAGTKQIVVEAGSSDNLFGIDVEAGTVLWKKHFDYKAREGPGGFRRTSMPRRLGSNPSAGAGRRCRFAHCLRRLERWPATFFKCCGRGRFGASGRLSSA